MLAEVTTPSYPVEEVTPKQPVYPATQYSNDKEQSVKGKALAKDLVWEKGTIPVADLEIEQLVDLEDPVRKLIDQNLPRSKDTVLHSPKTGRYWHSEKLHKKKTAHGKDRKRA